MLSLDRQNRYRERYKQINLGWRTSGEVYESFVRRSVPPRAGDAPRGGTVLDVGCGSGGVVELISRDVALAAGIDLDFQSLRRHRDPEVRRAVSGLRRLPFAAESFDLVVSSWVLEHLAEPEIAFAEIARVLRPGGHFVFITPNAHNLVTLINRSVPHLMQSRLVGLLYGRAEGDTFRVQYQANTVEGIVSLGAQAGLSPSALALVGDPTYLAFNEPLFRASVLLERLTPPRYAVHIVGDFQKGNARE
ncbi:MAG TPA: class I SAM-dependent methyltransferase [Ardenticatenaceae bacterium]|nr:class I SAM-dependent methyltransferase [Ardenticatenaceae bacterium]